MPSNEQPYQESWIWPAFLDSPASFFDKSNDRVIWLTLRNIDPRDTAETMLLPENNLTYDALEQCLLLALIASD